VTVHPAGPRAGRSRAGPGQRGDRGPGRDRREVRDAGGVVRHFQQRGRGQPAGGEERPAVERGPHLLERHPELDRGPPGPAQPLRDRQALQADAVGGLDPDRSVEALVAVHEAADVGLGRPLGQEVADDRAQQLGVLAGNEAHPHNHMMLV